MVTGLAAVRKAVCNVIISVLYPGGDGAAKAKKGPAVNRLEVTKRAYSHNLTEALAPAAVRVWQVTGNQLVTNWSGDRNRLGTEILEASHSGVLG